MNIQKNISLKNYNTFGIDVLAKEFVEINELSELTELLKTSKKLFLLGGGSNMLLTSDIEMLVVHLNLKGIEIIKEDDNCVYIAAAAGENWHDFVLWCIDHNYGGLENLSLIPGNVGTAPIQNIGAYGVEIKDRMHYLEAVNIKTATVETFKNKDCRFEYRNSVFKSSLKGKFIITKVIFKLSKSNHQLDTSYGAINEGLKHIDSPSIKDVSDAVIAIRKSKLPDPEEIGNSGSFFKNPVVSHKIFEDIKSGYSEVPSYSVSEGYKKIPAGWLIEKCGFKGKRYGNAGVHKNQALVLVNHGHATGNEILELAQHIQQTVKKQFHIELEFEVNII